MFSIRLQEPERPKAQPSTLSQRVFGKLIGFTAGLVLIVFADALVLDHAIWRRVLGGFAHSYPTVDHAIRGLGASLTRR